MKLFKKFFLEKPSFGESTEPVITLLYARRPAFHLAERIGIIAELEPTRNKPKIVIEQDWRDGSFLLAEINYDEHIIEIAGFPSPLPSEVMERTIYASPWSPDLKELLQSHLLNIMLCYSGSHPDPIERYLALYKTAGILSDPSLVGVINEPAWTCHPAYVIEQILEPRFLSVSRQSPPLVYWTGFVRGQWGEEYWALSKGNYLFGVPDFAFRLDYGSDAAEVNQLMHSIFDYFYFEKAQIEPGDGLQLEENMFFLFEEPDEEHAPVFATPGRVLVIRPTVPDELDTFDDWNRERE